jgi:hypothetical protein
VGNEGRGGGVCDHSPGGEGMSRVGEAILFCSFPARKIYEKFYRKIKILLANMKIDTQKLHLHKHSIKKFYK